MAMKTFQIFRAGQFTSMAGKNFTFGGDDLSRMAAAYSEDTRPANLVLGHPANDQPALGTVKKLIAKDGALYAIANVSDALLRLVKQGAYQKISAAFIAPNNAGNPTPGSYFLRHVGFLGAMPPAVKGLAALNFSERDGVCFAEGVHSATLAMAPDHVAQPQTVWQQSYQVDPERMAFHEAALCFQEAVTGASYAEAVTALRASGMPL